MPQAGPGLAGIRLAATLNAVDDIQEALRRMTTGTYGVCERCIQPIGTGLLETTPTARVCETCQALRRE